jgi:hypothetical protein
MAFIGAVNHEVRTCLGNLAVSGNKPESCNPTRVQDQVSILQPPTVQETLFMARACSTPCGSALGGTSGKKGL